MASLANSSTPHKHNSLTARSTDNWREWWRIESICAGSDWGALLRQHGHVFQRLCQFHGLSS